MLCEFNSISISESFVIQILYKLQFKVGAATSKVKDFRLKIGNNDIDGWAISHDSQKHQYLRLFQMLGTMYTNEGEKLCTTAPAVIQKE